MEIIGISGKKTHGKDTVAQMIMERASLDWEVHRFADKLKEIVCILLGCTLEQLEDHDYKETSLGPEWDRDPRFIEIWETIKGYPNYEISSYGNTRNIKHGRTLQQTLSNGYFTVKLYDSGDRKTFTVHSLVMTHFTNYEVSKNRSIVINHIDNDSENNRLFNLEVTSQRVNLTVHKEGESNIKKDPRSNSWQVMIKQDHYGSYDSMEKAIKRRDAVLENMDEDIPNITINKYPLTPRLILQLLGTEGGRETLHNNVWVNATMNEYKPLTYSDRGGWEYPNWIMPDTRFPNEASRIHKKKGLVFRVERSDIKSIDAHESETALDDYEYFDEIIYNDGSLEELGMMIDKIVKKYML